MADLSHLKPQPLWNHFSDLCQIPRPSKHEEQVLKYLEDKCTSLGLENFRDEIGNLIVRKKASPGQEQRKKVVLQSHVDMVPQKNSDKSHDFINDPITTIIEGDWLKADGTTLGADNGMGVASTLAVLAADHIQHGPLEALFTIDEETGMTGAQGLRPDVLKGEVLINLDSEDNGQIFIGCAGGVDVVLTGEYSPQPPPADFSFFEISVTGLKGGHSGVDIHLNRANSARLLHQILIELEKLTPIYIGSLQEGTLRNAIPREAFAKIALNPKPLARIQSKIMDLQNKFTNEFKDIESNIQIQIKELSEAFMVAPLQWSSLLHRLIVDTPNGVSSLHPDFPGVVETSSNLGVIHMQNGKIQCVSLVRSSSESGKKSLAERICHLYSKSDFKTALQEDYPGWNPNRQSVALKTVQEVHQKLFHKPGEIKVIHAGLECGILGSIYPHWDMISIGPTIRYPHSPDERVLIPSVQDFWKLLVGTLEAI
ncbi:MAG: aminoacyl-histidine dipeptidase [Bdellovibrionales bacterium]|nr:aminoacyl-histidine dipeptidase [Bdellovibrionales bacterium]